MNIKAVAAAVLLSALALTGCSTAPAENPAEVVPTSSTSTWLITATPPKATVEPTSPTKTQSTSECARDVFEYLKVKYGVKFLIDQKELSTEFVKKACY